jgi:tRNA-modifying protein YgfZ
VSIEAGYSALREGLGALGLERDVVRVWGPDAETYLQGQTSQDVARLASGSSAWALVLQPQGKLDVFVRVYRVGPDEFLLDSDAGMGAPLVTRLTRFKLRTKVDVEQLPWRAVAVRGPGAGEATPATEDGDVVIVPFAWGSLAGYDLLGPSPALPAQAVPVEPAAYEAVRVEAGFPRHGSELDERTIPAEAGLVDAAVSFTKGCYTGQELVARIDSRGSNVPRRLRGLLLTGPAQVGARLNPPSTGDGPSSEAVAGEKPSPEAVTGETVTGETVTGPAAAGPTGSASGAGPKELGRLTSLARSPRLGWVALGYVSRGVEMGSNVVVRDQEGEVEARVEPLPLT